MTTIARPYATAAFEYALAHDALAPWENTLDAAALVIQNAAVAQLLTNPSVNAVQLGNLVCDVLSKMLSTEQTNFIQLLAENNRLAALPEIAALFKTYREVQEKTLTVQVASAVKLDEKYQRKLVDTLTQRLKRQVSIECEIDPNLLGGVVVTAGDAVIDGSVRGKLNRLKNFISGEFI